MRYVRRFLAAFALGILWAAGTLGLTASAAEKPQYLKSVTYFGDEWPINFWGSEDKDMAANFEKIAEDGFNSIILVVPWREFQPETTGSSWNEAAFRRLETILSCAREHGLWVSLRIGYTWDYYGEAGLPERYRYVIEEDGKEREAWLAYSEKLYKTASAYDNFYGGFITWEDFWNLTYDLSGSLTDDMRVKIAGRCGFTDYLRSHYSLEELGEWYGQELADYSEAYIPRLTQPAAALFYEYYDLALMELLKDTQTVFPGLSMEVRADGDVIYDSEGSYSYYSHRATYACEGADYTALMYSVSLGQGNEGDRISADAALAAARNSLRNLRNLSGKPLYVEQLLYMDSTEEFSYNTQIVEEQVEEYIRGLAPILRSTTMGYGLWVYRNYVNNGVYNGQFGLGDSGWKFSESSQVAERNGTPMALISGGGSIYQNLNGRIQESDTIQVRFYAEPESQAATVRVTIGDSSKSVYVSEAGIYAVSIPWQSRRDFTISSSKRVFVDDVKVYSYEQNGRIYGVDGEPLDLRDAFRELNGALD